MTVRQLFSLCTSLTGHKEQLRWYHNYIVAVLSTPGQQDYPATYVLQIFDLRNKLIAISVPLAEVKSASPVLTIRVTGTEFYTAAMC